MHREGLKIQKILEIYWKNKRKPARAKGKRTTWLLLWDIIFEIDRCQQALSDDIIWEGRGPIRFQA